MTIAILKSFLMWCTLINYGILILWMLLLTVAKDWFYSVQLGWFAVSKEEMLRCNCLLFGSYKLAILILNAIPWLVLHLL